MPEQAAAAARLDDALSSRLRISLSLTYIPNAGSVRAAIGVAVGDPVGEPVVGDALVGATVGVCDCPGAVGVSVVGLTDSIQHHGVHFSS